jgi:nanoRNase/pAp phosphatase (c-di-AMP/oligoRNAs hydrolase)
VVNDVAKKFGGGGHNFAAGFVLNDLEKIKSLIKELSKKLK